MASQVPQLSPHSSEFGLVQYLMQIQMAAPNFQIAELYDISDKRAMSVFNDYVQSMENLNIVDVFINVKDLEQPLSDIMRHGIRIHNTKGLKIKVDKININARETSFQFIHCIVALGKVLNYQPPSTEVDDFSFATSEPSVEDCEGYDSLCVSPDHEFVIFNQEQIKTLHLVRFVGGDNLKPIKPVINICSLCGEPNATLWCENDSCKLCEKCDKESHSANKLMQKHIRRPLKEALPESQMCPIHKDQPCTYYCPKCHAPVCMECKIHGSHSRGENMTHKLIPLPEAYKKAMEAVKAPRPKYTQRLTILNEEVQKTDERLKEIAQNHKAVVAEIERLAREAIDAATAQTSNRSAAVKSAKTELLRKIEALEAIKDNLDTNRDNAEPLPFLQAYSHYMELEEEISANKDLPPMSSTGDDLVVYGVLEVAPEKHPQNSQQDENQPTATFSNAPTESGTYTGTETETATTTTEDEGPTDDTYLHPEPKDPHFTKLAKVAARKEEKYASRGLSLDFVPFAESQIVLEDADRRKIYLCLPFKEVPETHLMYATYRDGRSIPKMHKMIDGKGITITFVKRGEYVFGGFAATKWNSDGVPFGQGSSSFLFSLTRDALVPYRPQSDDPCYLIATRDTMAWGREDLFFGENFAECRSEIENSFGVGFLYGSEKAGKFLAGTPTFRAEQVEVWGFFAPE